MFYEFLAQVEQTTCTVNGQPTDCSEVGVTSGGLLAAIFIPLIILGIVSFAFSLWMLIHAIRHNTNNKVLWIVLIVLTGLIGSLVYFFVEKKHAEQSTLKSDPAVQKSEPSFQPEATTSQNPEFQGFAAGPQAFQDQNQPAQTTPPSYSDQTSATPTVNQVEQPQPPQAPTQSVSESSPSVGADDNTQPTSDPVPPVQSTVAQEPQVGAEPQQQTNSWQQPPAQPPTNNDSTQTPQDQNSEQEKQQQ